MTRTDSILAVSSFCWILIAAPLGSTAILHGKRFDTVFYFACCFVYVVLMCVYAREARRVRRTRELKASWEARYSSLPAQRELVLVDDEEVREFFAEEDAKYRGRR